MNKNIPFLTRIITIIGGSLIFAGIILMSVQKNNTEKRYMSYVLLVESALKKYSEVEVINGMTIPDVTIERLIEWDYLPQFNDAKVSIYKLPSFTISKDIIGNAKIPDVKLVFSNDTETKTCTKNSCS